MRRHIPLPHLRKTETPHEYLRRLAGVPKGIEEVRFGIRIEPWYEARSIPDGLAGIDRWETWRLTFPNTWVVWSEITYGPWSEHPSRGEKG